MERMLRWFLLVSVTGVCGIREKSGFVSLSFSNEFSWILWLRGETIVAGNIPLNKNVCSLPECALYDNGTLEFKYTGDFAVYTAHFITPTGLEWMMWSSLTYILEPENVTSPVDSLRVIYHQERTEDIFDLYMSILFACSLFLTVCIVYKLGYATVMYELILYNIAIHCRVMGYRLLYNIRGGR